MCLAVPSKVVEIKDALATIDVMGVRYDVSLMLMPVEVNIGDYVLVHAGFAIQRVEYEQDDEILKIFKEMFGETG
ncbi:MAG: HypC/HybG/HupF family hydrogenase formation chaperone [Nitrospirae bacterium]|nr:HypC/HybG/HupF family hydrogenase formation chaperone [Nitrospirota bacterium]